MYQKIFKIYTVPNKMLNKVKENKLLKIEELKAKEGNEIAKKIEEENKTGKVKKNDKNRENNKKGTSMDRFIWNAKLWISEM